MGEAAEKLAKNPEMLNHATEMMKNMSPEQMEAMMKAMPGGAPPGMDPNLMKQQMEMLSKNPDMMKTAMEQMSKMPEDERKKLLEARAGMLGAGAKGGGGGGGAAPGNMAGMMGSKQGAEAMKSMMENPDAMKQMMEMTKNIPPEQLAQMTGGDPEDAKMMQQAVEEMNKNPELGKQMSEMMKNMDPEQMEKMMEMSKTMRERRRGGGGSSGGAGGEDGDGPEGMDPAAMSGAMGSFMDDPKMMKAAEDMMKSMKPETLSAMAKSQGVDLDEDKARMMSRLVPWIMRLMRGVAYCRSVVKRPKEHWRVVVGVMILFIALLQRWFG